MMKGFKATRSFYRGGKLYMAGEDVKLGDYVNGELEKKGLIRWVERPDIIFPEVEHKETRKTRKKRDGNKSKK